MNHEFPSAAATLAALLDRAGQTVRYPRLSPFVTAPSRFKPYDPEGRLYRVAVVPATRKDLETIPYGAAKGLRSGHPLALRVDVPVYGPEDEDRPRCAGILARDGSFTPNSRHDSRAWPELADAYGAAVGMLVEVEEHGRAYLFEAGRTVGTCCFCLAGLSTPESVAAGYGPVCAERFGLPWGDVPDAPPLAEAAPEPPRFDRRRTPTGDRPQLALAL